MFWRSTNFSNSAISPKNLEAVELEVGADVVGSDVNNKELDFWFVVQARAQREPEAFVPFVLVKSTFIASYS